MCKGGGRGGVSQIVSRYIHGLKRCDRAFSCGGDPLLERSHFSGQRRLIPHRACRTSEKCGHFGSSLRKTEDVVYKQQYILILFVAKVFGDCESCQSHAESSTRGF